VRIEPLDAGDDQAMRAWHDVFLASHRHGRPYAVPFMLEEIRARLLAERVSERQRAWSGLVDGEVVATGMLSMSLQDNLDRADLDVQVRPDRRAHGLGAQMLRHLEKEALTHGRSVAVVEVAYPYDAPADGSGTAHADFAVRHGYAFALGNVQRVLTLPVDEEDLRALVAEAAPHHRDYTLRSFTGAIPEDLVQSFAAIVGTLLTEAPSGEIEHEPEVFDVARIRADEKVFAASGRTKFTTVALDRAGEVAAYSELVLPAHDPGRVYQWGTLARPQDRGHRLGLATKVRNLQRAQPRLGTATLVTFNAEVNAHMVGVNEQMGFRAVERLGEFQKRL
jgi:GNAT superfamily N-acetyltransferase